MFFDFLTIKIQVYFYLYKKRLMLLFGVFSKDSLSISILAILL